MARPLPATTWDPLRYFSSEEELTRLDQRFDYALRDATCLVFWTGVPYERAQSWASQQGLPTLTSAMGPLYSDHDPGSARYGKSSKVWSRYMKGASCRFAEYACRRSRRAIVLTMPPPNIYSTREWSNYRFLEEPILKGALGGCSTTRIDLVHPTVIGSTSFQYQVWPFDRSSEWYASLRIPLPKGLVIRGMHARSAIEDVVIETDNIGGFVVQTKQKELTNKKQGNACEIGHGGYQAELEQRVAREKKEAKSKKVELERQKAQEKKETRRKKVVLEQRIAREKKEAKRKKAELERQKAQEKEARRKQAELEQRVAREKKAAKRKKAELEQQKSRASREARRKQAEQEQRIAQEKKEAKRKKAELKRQKAKAKISKNCIELPASLGLG